MITYLFQQCNSLLINFCKIVSCLSSSVRRAFGRPAHIAVSCLVLSYLIREIQEFTGKILTHWAHLLLPRATQLNFRAMWPNNQSHCDPKFLSAKNVLIIAPDVYDLYVLLQQWTFWLILQLVRFKAEWILKGIYIGYDNGLVWVWSTRPNPI